MSATVRMVNRKYAAGGPHCVTCHAESLTVCRDCREYTCWRCLDTLRHREGHTA